MRLGPRSPIFFVARASRHPPPRTLAPSVARAEHGVYLLRLKRPRLPADFAASVWDAVRDVRAAIASGVVPEFDERIWKTHEYKEAFIQAQYGKCAYCEQLAMNHPGAIDHYAPKGELHEIIADGEEKGLTAKVEDRKTRRICATGYWWLAYEWNNWLFTCERCNSAWKRCLFPVREKARKLPPRRGVRETPLLRNPFGRVDPDRHLRFTALGEIVAHKGSDRGEATIRTCGLDRGSLRQARKGIAGDAYRHVRVLQASVNSGDYRRAREAIEDLLSLGADERPHAGMVRSIVKSELAEPECEWSELPTLSEVLAGLERKRARVSVPVRRPVAT